MLDYSKTPQSNQLRIGIVGRGNSGKSTLMNILTDQETSLVSEVIGTTTDPVKKSIELHQVGPCLLIDTPGYDDLSTIGHLRVQKTQELIPTLDIILFFIDKIEELDKQYLSLVEDKKVIYLGAHQKKWTQDDLKYLYDTYQIKVNVLPKNNIRDYIIKRISEMNPYQKPTRKIFQDMIGEQDLVMLVMPQDQQAPKSRLILPQVQAMRELLDDHIVFMGVTLDNMKEALSQLKKSPDLIVCDSQYFEQVYVMKPSKSRLTSFSVLFSAYKGDVEYFVKSANQLGKLKEDSKILIAEACSHAPIEEDIGRVKIPVMLRKRYGNAIKIDHVAGEHFPNNLSEYDLIIQCGGCMIHQNQMKHRINMAKQAGVLMTNYGMTIAYFKNILDKIDLGKNLKV